MEKGVIMAKKYKATAVFDGKEVTFESDVIPFAEDGCKCRKIDKSNLPVMKAIDFCDTQEEREAYLAEERMWCSMKPKIHTKEEAMKFFREINKKERE